MGRILWAQGRVALSRQRLPVALLSQACLWQSPDV
ncbi:hypothetical protein Y695_03945 [Hydrogenophaga sp. T4]|nr:hypothetical protein Y695_03945 [Hydrogenophaga sp. T4]